MVVDIVVTVVVVVVALLLVLVGVHQRDFQVLGLNIMVANVIINGVSELI